MSRTISFRYEDPDSTTLWNNMFRGAIPDGVYKGYAVSPGTLGGWWLKFTHETDPDNSTLKIGKLITRDGATIHENADQDNVCVGSVLAGLPNIHYVIASYTYNASTPVNDVVYSVRQGTPGSPPTPPVLGEDEVLLAEIYVPLGAASYASAGVQIRNVAHKYMGLTPGNLEPTKSLNLPLGIYYTGVYPYLGSAWNKVSLKSGRWVSYDNHPVRIQSDLADQFTPTDPGAGFYRFAWVIGAYKWADTNPVPSAEYLLVEGTPVALGAEALLPTSTVVRTAVAVLNPEYDTDGDGLAEVQYVNYLGSIRVENRAGTYYVNYYRGEAYLDRDTTHVYSSEALAAYRSGKYWGEAGLRQAVADAWALTKDRYPLRRPYTLLLDGDFQLSDVKLVLPSNLRLLGEGAPARLRSNASTVASLSGGYLAYNGVNDTITQSTPVIPDTPAGYQDREFSIQATYQVGDTLPQQMFSKGDRVIIECAAPAYSGEGIFVSTTSDWVFQLWVPDSYNTAGNPTNVKVWILKQNSFVDNVEVDNISTGNGAIEFAYLSRCGADRLVCRGFNIDSVYDSDFGSVRVIDTCTWGAAGTYPTSLGLWGRNLYRELRFETAVTVGALTEQYSDIHRLDVQNGALRLVTNEMLIGEVSLSAGFALTLGVGCVNTTIIKGPPVGVDMAASHTNRVLISGTQTWELGENPNSDRNLKMVSDALWAWDSVTGVLSWDDSVKFDNPWTAGYSVLPTGNALLDTDGDRLYVDIDRVTTGSAAITSSTRHKASAASDKYAHHRVFIAIRYGTVLYLWDGTRIESGMSVKLGQTPPPDGSVSWVKLATDAKAFHNRYFRDYVVIDDAVNTLLDVDVVFRNSTLATYTYTIGTGVVQYSGPVDLSLVLPGDYVIVREQDYVPGTGGKGAYTLEQIITVDDLNNRVTIRKGLDLTVGSANVWNGSIARGGKVVTNDNLVTYTYTPDGTNPGRVTYSSGLGFSQYQVRNQYVWMDSAGNKYLITDRDTTGNGDWITIAPNLRNVSVAAPTSKHHGSIETNYNPHRIPVADLRTPLGLEYVPINLPGAYDMSPQDLVRQKNTSIGRFRCCFTDPYDPRVRMYVQQGTLYGGTQASAPNTTRPYESTMPYASVVEFTGWCTGAALVTGDGLAVGAYTMWVDGEYFATGWGKDECVAYNTRGVTHNRFEPAINYSSIYTSRAYALPPGVHCIQWWTNGGPTVAGVLVFNQPEQNDTTRRYWDVPGCAVQDGEVRTYLGTQQGTMPISDQVWDKGGRGLRYIDKTGARQWATRWIRGHSGIGDTSVGSADVSEVTNPSSWMIGDLVMFINAGTKYIRCITNKVIDVLTLDNTLPFTSTATTFYYYGTSLTGCVSGNYHNGAERTAEEVARYIPMTDFAAPGALSTNYSAANTDLADPRSAWIVSLSDSETSLVSSATEWSQHQGFLFFDTLGATCNFTFVGCGVSVEYFSVGAKVEVWVDGAYCGLLPSSSGTAVSMEPGDFIAGELPYGTHTLQLVAQAGVAAAIQGFYVWQPKLPEIPTAYQPGLEIMDTNMVSSDRRVDVTVLTATSNIPTLGTVSQAGVNTCAPYSPGGNNPFKDIPLLISTSVHGVGMGYSNAGGVIIDSSLAFAFVGDGVTLSTPGINIGIGGNIYVEFLDHDGTWKVPSALTGFVVTGIDGWSASALAFGRYRWTSSKLGLHIMRFRCANAAQDLNVDGIEVHTPYHNHRSTKPFALRHSLPFQWQGADRRNITPFNADLIPRVDEVVSNAQHDIAATPGLADLEPFWFYSLGGPVEIQLSARGSSSGGWTLSLVVDGVTLPVGIQDGFTGDMAFHYHVTLWMPTGFHYVYLSGSNVTYAAMLSWTARATRQSNLGSHTRGLSLPSYGSAGPREASY